MRRKDTEATRPLRVGKGGTYSKRLIRPGDLTPAIEMDMYICLQAGGHLVEKNPCPIHRCPTTRYGE